MARGSETGQADVSTVLVADGRPGYGIDVLEEEALGGHTFERHIGKTEEYLKARILGSRRNIPYIGGFGERRAGSFTSVEAANKLINSMLAINKPTLDAFAERRVPMVLPFVYLTAHFSSPTGYEAYSPNDRAQPVMRATMGVMVHVVRTNKSARGWRVQRAWPINED